MQKKSKWSNRWCKMLKPVRNVRAFLDQGNTSKTSQRKLPDYKTISLEEPGKIKSRCQKQDEWVASYVRYVVQSARIRSKGQGRKTWGEKEEEEEERERAKMLCWIRNRPFPLQTDGKVEEDVKKTHVSLRLPLHTSLNLIPAPDPPLFSSSKVGGSMGFDNHL